MITKKQAQITKLMYKKSLKDGYINSQQVKEVIKEIVQEKPRNLQALLRAFRRLVAEKLQKEEVVIEAATTIGNQKQLEKTLIKKTGARKVIYKANPSIVFGAKITSGDWIWDATLDSKLNRLLNG